MADKIIYESHESHYTCIAKLYFFDSPHISALVFQTWK